jgi:hypothetical protein
MNKETASQWYEAYRILQEKKQQEQAEFNAIGLRLAKEQINRNRMTFRECKAWSDWCKALPREQARPGSGLQGTAAGWLLNRG